MSTRSFIAKENENGTITYIFCRFDGYLEGVGRMLFNHYKNETLVDGLMAYAVKAYPDDKILTAENEQVFLDRFTESSSEYCYLFRESKWHIWHKGRFKPLSRLLQPVKE